MAEWQGGRIALIDYGAGNLTSVRKALAALEAQVFVPSRPEELDDVRAVIVPGVGHFGATRALDASWKDAILNLVGVGRPLLGICLGMQWLYEASDEEPACPGLGLLNGCCYRLQGSSARGVKVPHVGWNALRRQHDTAILDGVQDGDQVYFTHSYVAPVTGDTAAVTEHGETFASVVQRGQVAGVQFHPEKSGAVGMQVLRNFLQSAG
jgi:glutamine amidotransferase